MAWSVRASMQKKKNIYKIQAFSPSSSFLFRQLVVYSSFLIFRQTLSNSLHLFSYLESKRSVQTKAPTNDIDDEDILIQLRKIRETPDSFNTSYFVICTSSAFRIRTFYRHENHQSNMEKHLRENPFWLFIVDVIMMRNDSSEMVLVMMVILKC